MCMKNSTICTNRYTRTFIIPLVLNISRETEVCQFNDHIREDQDIPSSDIPVYHLALYCQVL